MPHARSLALLIAAACLALAAPAAAKKKKATPEEAPPVEQPAPEAPKLVAGSPFHGAYELTELWDEDSTENVREIILGISPDYIHGRWVWFFEGTQLRSRMESVTKDEERDGNTDWAVCEAELIVQVPWTEAGFTIPADVKSEARARMITRTPGDDGGGDFDTSTYTCSVRMGQTTFVVHQISEERQDGRPLEIILKEADAEVFYRLVATEGEVEYDALIDRHLGG